MIFYHVSTNLNHSGIFIPRIPDHRHKGAEDDMTPRVSVSPSIEGCLTAIPGGGMLLDETNYERRGYYKVFIINTDKLKISSSEIVATEELFEKDLVRDADLTDEYWITTAFIVPEEDSFLIKLQFWGEECVDDVPYSIYKIAEEKYDGDYINAYDSIYNDNIPCTTVINNAIYYNQYIKAGEVIQIDYNMFESERDALIEFIKENYRGFNITDNTNLSEIKLSFEEDTDLKDLFLYHYKLAEMYQ